MLLQQCIRRFGRMGHRTWLILLLVATTAVALGSSSPSDTLNQTGSCRRVRVSCHLRIVHCNMSWLWSNTHSWQPLQRNNGVVPGSKPYNHGPVVFLQLHEETESISESHISALLTDCFTGLHHLEELYLPFSNTISESHVAPGVFALISELRVFHVQGLDNW